MPQIRLAVIKDRLVPADVDSYRRLHALKVPNVSFPYSFIDTLKVLTNKKRITLIGVPFESIHSEFVEKINNGWTKDPRRKMVVSKGTFRFEARGLNAPRDSFAKLETRLRDYFARWGFDATYDYSETATRARLVVEYKVSKTNLPVIPFRDIK